MSADLVRVCPACGAHQPPDRMRCDCGTLLFGVDLTRPPAADTATSAPEVPPATPSAAAQVRCPHADCDQPNLAGSRICLYCNRPLNVDAAAPAAESRTAPALLQLPAALRARYRVLEAFKASGAEADILLVERSPSESQTSAPLVAKIYRQGILPSSEVQARIARVDARHRVTMFETGLSDGHAYEVMEYCAHGSLRQHLNGQAQPSAFIAEVIGEMAGALQAVHAAALVHRDVKPENVLLRSEQPLDLVLTDFSTASAIDATQRFTGMARTLLYAAPEALSGVLDAKADYWALGIMLLEMATGAHPFRGLSDAVILHHLSTRAMDVSGVADVRLRLLLSGLLLRDPKRRWGAPEVSRWLAGDTNLPSATERHGEPGFAQPYAVLGERCTTPEQLAVAFARHWQAGVADLDSSQLLRWFTNVHKDQNAVRLLLGLRHDSGLNVDQQLLRFILHYAPGIPPMWQGRGIELPALLAQASLALRGDETAGEWLTQLYRQRVLDAYAAAGNAQLAELAERWNAGVDSFNTAWQACVALLRSHNEAAAPDPGRVVSYDDVVYGRHGSADPAPPPPAVLHPRLLAAAYDPAWVERLRGKLAREWAALAMQHPRLADPGDPGAMTPAQLLACQALLPELRKTVERQTREEAQRRQRQEKTSAELRTAFRANLAKIGMHARRVAFLFPDTVSLRRALREHADLMARIRAHDDIDEEWLALRRQALRSEPVAQRLRDLCDRLSERATANAGWFGRETSTYGFVALFVFWMLRFVGGILFLLATIVGAALWRRLPVLQMVRDIRRLGRSIQPDSRQTRQD
ncbi:MAG: protein kinase [Azonexus sp.]|jgi:tRNA A-37 threonylcarbamoyl transferase component Bud32|uniref:protein kinase domain-containing protein n=1 Tax=Azonexus sp. TaxID=1872668 RepID=UPI0028208360|nr:protein kinase [Azonexus sp.]MDR0777291.1 protein kinase [Azonexus sp.]